MKTRLLQRNPRLKYLLPLLLACLVLVSYVYLLKPQLAYRDSLRQSIAEMEAELKRIEKAAASFTVEEREKINESNAALRKQAGLGFLTPEIVVFLEEKAAQTGASLLGITFTLTTDKNNFTEIKLDVSLRGTYGTLVAYEKSLEEFPPFAGTSKLNIRPYEDGQTLSAFLTLSFLSVPENLAKIKESPLPVKEHPFYNPPPPPVERNVGRRR